MWHCPQCGEDHEDVFDACWNCGGEKNHQVAKHIRPEHEAPTAPVPDSAPPDIRLVRRGRVILLALIGTCVIYDLIWISTWHWQVPPWKFIIGLACAYGLWYGLWYAVWRGYTWANTLMKIFAAIVVILGPIVAVLDSDITVLADVVLFGAIWACLTKSKSVKEFFRHQRPPGPPQMKRLGKFEKIAALDNEIEALCLRGKLEERGIPHMMQSNYDLAYDGLFQFSGGWGHVEAQVEHKDEILEIIEAIRFRSAQPGGNSGN